MATPRPPQPTHEPRPRAPARKTGEHDDDDGQTWLEALEETSVENGPGGAAPIAPAAEPDPDADADGRDNVPHERIRTDHEPK